MARIFVGTNKGLHELDQSGRQGAVQFPGREVTALAPEGWNFWAVVDGREIWHTAGEPWWFHVGDLEGLRGNCLADTRAGVIIGTSEAHLYRVAGEGVENVTGFDEVEGRSKWYTPWGGPPDSRSMTEDDQAVFVNVHVGGIVRTRDQGDTWEPTIDIDADVHKVWASDGRVLAAGAHGLGVSTDRGETWTTRTEGLHASYCRGVAVCGESVLVSASTGPRGGRATVYRGTLDGPSFERSHQGLPEWFDDNIDSYWLDAIPSGEFAAFGTSDGRLFGSSDQGATWAEVASGLPSIRCVLVVP